MRQVKELLDALSDHLQKLARKNAVVASPITIGSQSLIPLCELSVGFGGGGGRGEAQYQEGLADSPDVGSGGGAGGAAKARPVAVIIVEGENVRLERLD